MSLTPTSSKEELERKQKIEQQQATVTSDDGVSVVESQAIRERKLTWVEATLLLLTEYVVLAILAFPSSYLILGMAGGVLSTLIIGVSTYYTSHVLWRYCLKHPEIRDICASLPSLGHLGRDAAYVLTGSKIAWFAAFVGLALNNWAIMGLHVNAVATAIQSIRGGTETTLFWACMMGVIMLIPSYIREFKHMSYLGTLAAFTMFICVILTIAGHGVQPHPNYWPSLGTEVTYTVWAPKRTTFIQGMNALLNIVYTWIGHALIPSFVGDMERPEDFPKALAVSMLFEFILFTLTGALVYFYAGQYSTAPGYGSLIAKYGKVAAGFTLPTIVIVGVLYSLVTSKAVFYQIFREGSRHRTQHTVLGWSTWFVVVTAGWIISFIIGQAIPFFNDLLALISSLFDSWFGYILWALCWFQLYRGRYTETTGRKIEFVVNIAILITGIYFFGAGTYASVQSIINSYHAGAVKTPFTKVDTGFTFPSPSSYNATSGKFN
ncbi:BQ2448_102 [Microbotryum intermedium]|uniref:BQ2448_102 protein n=1 Tax=Microbotryum intermedium TaxID=269621 RepID=A0A238F7C7_9BASI|nr:BQ2448_102 [Microbotryum intermedium]